MLSTYSTISIKKCIWENVTRSMSGRKFGIFCLRIFVSIIHVHILDEKRTKLDNKNEKCSFIGYHSNIKGCKVCYSKMYYSMTKENEIGGDMTKTTLLVSYFKEDNMRVNKRTFYPTKYTSYLIV